MARKKRSPGSCRSASEKPQTGSRRLCRFSKSFEEGKYEEFKDWYPNSRPGHYFLHKSPFLSQSAPPLREQC